MAKPEVSAILPKTRKQAALLSAGVAAVGTAAAFGGAVAIAHKVKGRRFEGADGPIYVKKVKDADGQPMKVMICDGAYQSATYMDDRRFDPPFEYLRAFERLFEAAKPAKKKSGLDSKPMANLLMIGGGGYAFPKFVAVYHPEARIDVVESDPAVTALALDEFYLDEAMLIAQHRTGADAHEDDEADAAAPEPLGLIEADGLEYLQACDTRYDAIINDAFNGALPASELLSPEALKVTKKRLTKKGLYLVNVVAEIGSPVLDAVMEALGQHWANVYAIPAIDKYTAAIDNTLLIATDGTYAFSDVACQLCQAEGE